MKNILITGAAGNLGTAVVQKFLDSGYQVIATAQDNEQLQGLSKHSLLEAHVVNLTDEKETSAFISNVIERFKKIDGGLMLVGGFAMGSIEESTGDDVKSQYSLNFETAYYTARPLFSHMMKNEYGRLIFVGARPALDPMAGKGMIAYALSKSLLFKLAEFINASGKKKNVTATVVVPSTIDTPANRKSMPDANPGDWVKASQIADLMELVCSDKGDPLRETVFKIYGKS